LTNNLVVSKVGIFDELNIKPLINAAGTYTVIGGSKMSDKTYADMREISSTFVQMRELQKTVNEKISELTKNEAACVTNGAAAGLYLAIAAAIQNKLVGKRFYYLNRDEISKCNIVMFKAHRNPYDLVIGQLGAEYNEVSFPNLIFPPTVEDLEMALNENTAAFYYALSGWTAAGDMPLEKVIEVCGRRNIPVIVDAAAQLPPVSNLWSLTAMGADVVLFSGGKDLKGPQSSGLVVGAKQIVDIMVSLNFPNYGIGRMLIVGREELIGLYSAIKQYVELDHDKRLEHCEAQVKLAIDSLADNRYFTACRSFPNEAGQPIPRVFVRLKNGIDVGAAKEYLLNGTPAVYVMNDDEMGFFLNPMTLEKDEMEIILEKLNQFSEVKK
jgi:L-seryl-tRNA(Ser) seleniumtransferase